MKSHEVTDVKISARIRSFNTSCKNIGIDA